MRPRPVRNSLRRHIDPGPKLVSPKRESPPASPNRESPPASPKRESSKSASTKRKPPPKESRRVIPEPVLEPIPEPVPEKVRPAPVRKNKSRPRARSVNSSLVRSSPLTEESLKKSRDIHTHVQGRKLANLLNRSRKTKNNVRKAENESVASLKNLLGIRQTYQLKRVDVNRITGKNDTGKKIPLKNRRERERITFSSMNSVVRPIEPPRSIPRTIAERKARNLSRRNPKSTVSKEVFQAFKQNQPESNLPRSLEESVPKSVPKSVPAIEPINENTYKQFQFQPRYHNSKSKPKSSRKP